MSELGMLSVDDQTRIEGHLHSFLEKSEALWAALVDRGGNLFAEYGDTKAMDMSILCALAAGSFAATRELAKRLGEVEFTALFHEGESISILMTALAFDCLLLIVFDEKTNIGLVRFYAQQIAETLNAALHTASEVEARTDPLQVEGTLKESDGAIIQ
jgi:predicted regulator of Ras-like GTPase activity (Roadblock/LC7/MglB family)